MVTVTQQPNSDDFFPHFMQLTSDYCYIVSAQGIILDVNPSAQRALGCTRKELLGKMLLTTFAPESQKGATQLLEQWRREGGRLEEAELTILSKSGERRAVLLTADRVLGPGGELICSIFVQKDITERKRLEEVARRNEAHLQEAQKLAKLGRWELDLRTSRLEWSQTIFDIFELPPETFEASYEAFLEAIHPADKDLVMRAFAASLKSGEPYEIAHRLLMRDGRIKWVREVGRTEYDSGGRGLRTVGIVQDITDQKQAEAKREQLLKAIEQAGDAIVITDPSGVISYVNPAFELITGYGREEAQGRNPSLLKSGEQGADFYRDMWATITRGETWNGRIINKKKDGSLYTEEATISPVTDDSGNIVNFVAVKHDMTEHLKISEEKTALEERIRQSQKLESIGRLAGGVAHDLNNLLSPILGYGDMLLDEMVPSDSRRNAVEQIVNAGVRARDLVRQLLALGRKQLLEFRPVDINDLVTRFTKLLHRTIREDILIELDLAPTLRPISGDIGQLEQVIMNLAVNAQDAMPKGGRLRIETGSIYLDEQVTARHDDMAPGDFVVLRIIDTGAGMDEATKKRLFEPFFTTKPQDKGTGLGLATSYGIVRQHGGDIRVHSQIGRGSTFEIFIPLSEEPLDLSGPPALPVAQTYGEETVLLVEDHENVRDLTYAILRRHGYTVLVADGAASALKTIEAHEGPIHLLLTDVIMPRMSGTELFDRVVLQRRDIKVLYMSGYPGHVLEHHGLKGDAALFIPKPFSVRALATKIRAVLDGSDDPSTE